MAVTWIAVLSVCELVVMICVRGFVCDMRLSSGHDADTRKRNAWAGRSKSIRVFWNAVLALD